MSFSSNAFKEAAESLNGRSANANTAAQRIGLGDTSEISSVNTFTNNATNNASQAERQGYANANEALANNPIFQQTNFNNARNFVEDSRRFDKGLSFKDTADARANETNRLQSGNQLEGVKYNADASVKSTGIQAEAQKYGYDKNLEGNKYAADTGLAGIRINADANRYGADRNYQASIYGADRGLDATRIGANAQVDSARIGADASRFNALLGAGTTFFNSSQYRPTFNR